MACTTSPSAANRMPVAACGAPSMAISTSYSLREAWTCCTSSRTVMSSWRMLDASSGIRECACSASFLRSSRLRLSAAMRIASERWPNTLSKSSRQLLDGYSKNAIIANMRYRDGHSDETAMDNLRRRIARADNGWFFAKIADRVAERRAELGLSQQDLARLVGTTQSAIARLERGG